MSGLRKPYPTILSPIRTKFDLQHPYKSWVEYPEGSLGLKGQCILTAALQVSERPCLKYKVEQLRKTANILPLASTGKCTHTHEHVLSHGERSQ